MGNVLGGQRPSLYPFETGFQRFHENAISFDDIRNFPRRFVTPKDDYYDNLQSAYYSSYTAGYISKNSAGNKIVMFIRDRLGAIEREARARHREAARAFIRNPYLPKYPKMCGHNGKQFTFLLMIGKCCPIFLLLLPLLLPVHACICYYDSCFPHTDKEISEWNSNLMKQFPHYDHNVLDAWVTTAMEQLATELNARYNMAGFYFQYSYQPNCIKVSHRSTGSGGERSHSYAVNELWDRFVIIVSNTPPATAPALYTLDPPLPYYPTQNYGQEAAFVEAIVIPHDHHPQMIQSEVVGGGEYMMVPMNTGPSIMQPAVYYQPNDNSNRKKKMSYATVSPYPVASAPNLPNQGYSTVPTEYVL